MLSLMDFPEFRHFLSSLFVKGSKNEMLGINQITEPAETPWFVKLGPDARISKSSFWFEHLSIYSIASAEIFNDFTYYARVDVTLKNRKGSDVLAAAYNCSNCGDLKMRHK